jgi:hypothetical protein
VRNLGDKLKVFNLYMAGITRMNDMEVVLGVGELLAVFDRVFEMFNLFIE